METLIAKASIPTEPWKVVDLFSGCGGMSTGFHRKTGYFRLIGAVDLEVAKPGKGKQKPSSTSCNRTYERNIGLKPLDVDIRLLEPTAYRRTLELEREELDVLIACPPCTGFSQKNSKNHLNDDPRNSLVVRVGDFVAEFMPEYLVMENVKEFVQGKNNHHFKALLNRLETLSYYVYFDVHDLSDFGLPQRRERALLVARRGSPLPGFSLGKVRCKATVRDAISHLPALMAGEQCPLDPMHVSPGMTADVLARIRAIPRDGGSWGDIMNNPSLTYAEKEQLLIPSMFRAKPGSFPDVYGRLAWDTAAATITRECGHVGNGRYSHPEQDRLLTVKEMAILQGFPSSYVFVGPIAARYNQIGDAVPPLISSQIADKIIDYKFRNT